MLLEVVLAGVGLVVLLVMLDKLGKSKVVSDVELVAEDVKADVVEVKDEVDPPAPPVAPVPPVVPPAV